jgi:hypothetical protein
MDIDILGRTSSDEASIIAQIRDVLGRSLLVMNSDCFPAYLPEEFLICRNSLEF